VKVKSLMVGVCLLAWLPEPACTQPLGPANGQSISLGQATARLDGPWRFHAGDDPAWAAPGFDDSQWERVDLTASAGSHDADVGLSGYVDGWGGRGHRGMSGYGWYRLHLQIDSSAGQALAIAGPPAVDSAYQIFWDGEILGGIGDLRGASVRVFSIKPRLFPLPHTNSTLGNDVDVLAVRVWMGPWDLADPKGGGIRIAPTLGTSDAVRAIYQSEWIETLRGYVVEVAEAFAFACLCLALWLLAQFELDRHKYRWLYAALVLTAACRLNQAIFFWGQFESVPTFVLVSLGFLYPLCLAAWTMGWARVSGVQNTLWVRAFASLTFIYLAAALSQHAMLLCSTSSPILTKLNAVISSCRLCYLAATIWILFKLSRSKCRSRWFLCSLIVFVSIGQFARELSQIGVPNIWFPFGTGVSRAQFAYALFLVVAAAFLCVRLGVVAETCIRQSALCHRDAADNLADKGITS